MKRRGAWIFSRTPRNSQARREKIEPIDYQHKRKFGQASDDLRCTTLTTEASVSRGFLCMGGTQPSCKTYDHVSPFLRKSSAWPCCHRDQV